MYRKSKYNIFVKYKNGKTIIFNTLSGAIGLFDEETVKRYFADNLTSKEINILLEKGVLVKDREDEKKRINSDRISGIVNPKIKHFRIWTTSACNAQCYYCFEKGIAATSMTARIATDVADFILESVSDGDKLWLEWFGGEPLLNTSAIDVIMEKLRTALKIRKCTIRGSIVTNGSLITDEIAIAMKEKWGIQSAQITLDGYNEDYDKIKNYKNAQYNFSCVIHSIHLLANCGIDVTIRMNYDVQNFDSLCRLVKYLHVEFTNSAHIKYYVYPVWSSLDQSFQSKAKADENLLRIYDYLVEYKMNTWRKLARLNYRANQCHACSTQSFTIFPDGTLGKCSEVYTQKIGDIYNGVVDNEIFQYWTKDALDKKCETCIYLPICQGGCRAYTYSNMEQCFPHKEIFDRILIWYVDHLCGEESKNEQFSNNEK